MVNFFKKVCHAKVMQKTVYIKITKTPGEGEGGGGVVVRRFSAQNTAFCGRYGQSNGAEEEEEEAYEGGEFDGSVFIPCVRLDLESKWEWVNFCLG